MKNKMIAVLASLMITLSMAPKKSEAGLVIGALAGNPGMGATIGGAIGGAWIGVGLVVTNFDPFSDEISGPLFMVLSVLPGVAVALLDVDAGMSKDQLTEGFKKAFPFVDNTEVFQDLSVRAKTKLAKAVEQNPEAKQAFVQFSSEEVNEIFSSVDLSGAELHLIQEALN